MSWITVIWGAAAGACLALGIVQFLAWCGDRTAWARLWFAGVTISVALIACAECAIMRVTEPSAFLALHRVGHVGFFFTLLCIVGFIQAYFGTGRSWLAWTLIGVRLLILGLAFIPGRTFNFQEVTALVPYPFLGETLMAPQGTPSGWARVGEATGLLLVVYVADAAVRLWRRGSRRDRQRALVVGGGVALFVGSCLVNSRLVHGGAAQAPYFISLSFLFIVGAMGFELSRDLMHTARIAEELRESAESMNLAANAAHLALWLWNIPGDVIWVSPNGRGLYGLAPDAVISLRGFLDTLHPDDREPTRQAVARALQGDGLFRAEYRVVLPEGGVRWIHARGKVEFDAHRHPLRMRGVSIDVSDRKAAELELSEHRAELAHLTRVTTLSELSGSLAHELNQPLAIILSNAQAAQRLLEASPPDVKELRDILADIVEEDRRAGEVIGRLRALLKRGESIRRPMSLNEVVEEVLRVVHGDLMVRGATVALDLETDLPSIKGDRVQLQQVVLNLVMNAVDAMSFNPPGERRLHIRTARQDGGVRVSVRDAGGGLPRESERVFEPYYTTKPQGLGMGLAICRTIIIAHGGRIWAEPHSERGTLFHFEIPSNRLEST